MQTYTVWTKKYMTSADNPCIRKSNGDYVCIETGEIFPVVDHYNSEQLIAKIVGVDSINQTGMLHLNEEDDEEENRKSWKERYIGCIVTVERAHYAGDLTIYRCLELGDYWSSNEIELL